MDKLRIKAPANLPTKKRKQLWKSGAQGAIARGALGGGAGASKREVRAHGRNAGWCKAPGRCRRQRGSVALCQCSPVAVWPSQLQQQYNSAAVWQCGGGSGAVWAVRAVQAVWAVPGSVGSADSVGSGGTGQCGQCD